MYAADGVVLECAWSYGTIDVERQMDLLEWRTASNLSTLKGE